MGNLGVEGARDVGGPADRVGFPGQNDQGCPAIQSVGQVSRVMKRGDRIVLPMEEEQRCGDRRPLYPLM
jgi:hypothetical protein